MNWSGPRIVYTALICCMASPCLAQEQTSSKFLVGGGAQFLGRMKLGGHFETALPGKRFLFSGLIGVGMNEFRDEDSTDLKAISALPYMEFDAGFRIWDVMYISAGAGPTVYRYGSTWFTDLNGWLGLRYLGHSGYTVAAGYVPKLYSTYSDSDGRFNDYGFAIRFGALLD